MKKEPSFTENCTIHGIKYIGDKSNPRFVRMSWIIAILISIFGLFVCGNQIYVKWNVKPEISFTEKLRPIRELPFPAITICPDTKFSKRFMDYDKIIMNISTQNITGKERELFEVAPQICGVNNFNEMINFTSIVPGGKIVEILNETSFNIMENMKFCITNGIGLSIKCSEFSKKVLTDKGYCFAINMLEFDEIYNADIIHDDFKRSSGKNSRNWDFEKDYIEGSGDDYPHRINNDGKMAFQILTLVNKSDISIYCQAVNQGFTFFLHTPNEVQNWKEFSIAGSKNQDKTILLTAESSKASESLRHYTPEQRQCFFQGERPLKFFKSYTKTNCELECFTNSTLKKCDCVKFSMPRDKVTAICNFTQLECMFNVEQQWPAEDEDYKKGMIPCKCFESCRNIKYRIKHETSGKIDIDAIFPGISNLLPG